MIYTADVVLLRDQRTKEYNRAPGVKTTNEQKGTCGRSSTCLLVERQLTYSSQQAYLLSYSGFRRPFDDSAEMAAKGDRRNSVRLPCSLPHHEHRRGHACWQTVSTTCPKQQTANSISHASQGLEEFGKAPELRTTKEQTNGGIPSYVPRRDSQHDSF